MQAAIASGRGGDAAMRLYDVKGMIIKTFYFRNIRPGYHSVVWDGLNDAGRSVPSGMYVYEFTMSQFTKLRRLVLVK